MLFPLLFAVSARRWPQAAADLVVVVHAAFVVFVVLGGLLAAR